MIVYSEEELLMLSGIQHIAFCERQYALAYIEMQWNENLFTLEGHHLHERVDNPFEDESRGGTLTWRSHYLVSYFLGLYGRADVVELVCAADDDPDSIKINERKGRWKLVPVEYKRGKPKCDERDEVQLCAQAICLEEMYKTRITEGYLFYGNTRHRHQVAFEKNLREQVVVYSNRMHEIFKSYITPLPEYKPHCRSCSLSDLCLPKSMGKRFAGSEYLLNNLIDK